MNNNATPSKIVAIRRTARLTVWKIVVKKEETPCKRCGRTLTNEVSIDRQYGPVCWNKQHKQAQQKQFWQIRQNLAVAVI